MELEEAKDLFDEIVDLCYGIDHIRLVETSESLYKEVVNAKEVQEIIECAEEITVILNEMDILDEDEDTVREIREKIELLSE
jgi:hypothetical protein